MSRDTILRNLAALITLGLVFSTVAHGQVMGSAAISGTVTDPSNAVIPGAKVTVVQNGTSMTRTVVTNASGRYELPSLPPADYAVNVQAAGFKDFVESVTLLADQSRALNIQMAVGTESQRVTVQATAAMVNTVTPTLSQVIDQSRVTNLPLLGRNPATLTLLVPGTTNANGHGTQQGTTKQIPDTV